MNETFWENVGVFIIIWTMLCMFYFIIYSYVDKKGKTKGYADFRVKDIILMILFLPITILVLIGYLLYKLIEISKFDRLKEIIIEWLNKPVGKEYSDDE